MGAVRHTQEQRSDRPGGRRYALPLGIAWLHGAFAAGRLGGGHLCLWFGMLALLVVSIGAMAHPLPAAGAMPMAFDDGTEPSIVSDSGGYSHASGGDGHRYLSLSGTCSVVSCDSFAAVLPMVKTIRPVSSVALLPALEHERAGVDPDPFFHPPKPSLST